MTTIRWDESEGQWASTLTDGTIIRSPSKTELEAFLDMLASSPAARRRESIINAGTLIAVAVLIGVTAVSVWLW
jgi:hypothetical protein